MENKAKATIFSDVTMQSSNSEGRTFQTIHEKRKNLFISLHKHHTPDDDITRILPDGHAADLLRIEVLLHRQRTDDLIRELQTRNDFSMKIVKNRKFCESLARKLERDPASLAPLLPATSFVAKTALFKNLAKNSLKLDGAFDIILERYGLSVAQHVLPACSKTKVEEVLQSFLPRLTPKQLRLLYKNHVDLFKWYLKRWYLNVAEDRTLDKTIWSFLAKADMVLFSELALGSLDKIQVKLGQKLTKKLVRVAKSKLVTPAKFQGKVHWKTFKFLVPEARNGFVEKVDTDSYLDRVKQLPMLEALGEVTKKLSVTRSKKMRCKYGRALAEIAGKDSDLLAKVLGEHAEQDRDFLKGFLDELLNVELDAKHWPILLKILDKWSLYDRRENFLLKSIRFEPSDDAILAFMQRYNNGYRYDYAKAGKFERTLLLACIRLMPRIQDDDEDNEIFDLALICAIFEYNKRHPKDRLDFQHYDRLRESLRKSIEKLEGSPDLMSEELQQILDHLIVKGDEEMLQAWSRVAEKYYSRTIFEWLLRRKPASLNFVKFLEYSIKYFYGRPIEVEIYRRVKQHAELASEAKAFFLEKKCEIDDWDYRKKVLVIMALLMAPEEFCGFIKTYPPTKYKWFDDEAIVVSLRYANTSSVLPQLLNSDELCNEQAIESLCYLHLHLAENNLVKFQPVLSRSKLRRYGMIRSLPVAHQQLPTVKAALRVVTKAQSLPAWSFLKTLLQSELLSYDSEATDMILSKLERIPEQYHVELQALIWESLDADQKPELLSLLSTATLAKLEKLPEFVNLEIYGKLAAVNPKASLPDTSTEHFDAFIKGFATNVQNLNRLEELPELSNIEATEEYLLVNFAKLYLGSSAKLDAFADLLKPFCVQLISELGLVATRMFAGALQFFVSKKFVKCFEESLLQICKVLLTNGDADSAIVVLQLVPEGGDESGFFEEVLEKIAKDPRGCVKAAYCQYLRKKM